MAKLMAQPDLAKFIRQAALLEGFAECRFCRAVESSGFHRLVDWIESGYAAQMNYFANRLDAYRHPEGVLPGAKSIAVLVWPYDPIASTTAASLSGRVARYTSMGDDYHEVIHSKMKRILRSISASFPIVNSRGVVDTAPINEREVAELAGIGWRGKNTLLLSKTRGSYFFLACILFDEDLPAEHYAEPQSTSHCGTCTACLDACPTDAFVSAGVLDAGRCISYLTIEHRGMPSQPLRPLMGDWLFGCDVCQEVCPWNRKPTRRAEQVDAPEPRTTIDLIGLMKTDDEAFRERFRGTPMWRTRRRGLLRNAAIVLGNLGDRSAIPTLIDGLSDDEPLVRAACVWALRQFDDQGDEFVDAVLSGHRLIESDPAVLDELAPKTNRPRIVP